jgi:hypothetical protein
MGCGAILKEFKNDELSIWRHECTACKFRISEEKLSSMVVRKDRPLEPPEFIKELRRNKWLEKL